MRGALVLAVLTLTLALLSVASIAQQVEIPTPAWVMARQKLGWKGYSSSGEFDGHAEISAVPRALAVNYTNFPDGTSAWHVAGIVRMVGYEGIVSYAPGFPLVYAKLRIWGYVEAEVALDASVGRVFRLYRAVGANITYKHTVASLYHRASDETLYAILRVAYLAGAPGVYVVELKWFREVFNETAGMKETAEVASVYASATLGRDQPLILEFWLWPNFYELNITSASGTNETHLVFGFKGGLRATCASGCAVDEGTFRFAWETLRLGPRGNITEADVKSFVEQLTGWYVWVGAGLYYYEPYGSIYEMFPYPGFRGIYYPLTPTVGEQFEISGGEVLSYNYTFYLDIDDYYAENWVVDGVALYAAFVSGSLEAYTGAYMNVVDAWTSPFYDAFARGMLPYVIAAMLVGWSWRATRWAGFIYLIVVLAVGAMARIFAAQELVVGVLTLVVGFMYKLVREEVVAR